MRRELLADNTLRILGRAKAAKDEGIVQAVAKVTELLSPRLHHLAFPDPPEGSGNTDVHRSAPMHACAPTARSIRLSDDQIFR
jgi:hypothetical protein